MKYSELDALARLKEYITIKQFGLKCFIREKPTQEDIEAARKGLAEVKAAVTSGEYDVVVLDEANIATYYGLYSADELLETIDARPEHVEIVVTGRYADKKIMDRADLVTEMREVKHYFEKGVEARQGIEK
jgi:cob(I)alamin adenosyltransferase